MTADDWDRVAQHLRVAALSYADGAENPKELNEGVIKEFRKQKRDAQQLAERIERGER